MEICRVKLLKINCNGDMQGEIIIIVFYWLYFLKLGLNSGCILMNLDNEGEIYCFYICSNYDSFVFRYLF